MKKSLALILSLALLVSFAVPFTVAASLDEARVQSSFAVAEPVEEAPVEEPAEEPAPEAPAEEPADEPADEPVEEPADEPADEPVEEPADEPVEEPADEPVDEPEINEPEAGEPEAEAPGFDAPIVEETIAEPSDEFSPVEETAEEPEEDGVSYSTTISGFMRIVHVDCGRKYFTVDQLKGIIDMASENNYTHVQLAIGNNGLRFLLDNMAVGSYSSSAVTSAIQAGNSAYTSASNGELSQSDMDSILSYAASKGIEIIPLLNIPGHANALLYAAQSLTGSTLSYNGSGSTFSVINDTATGFALDVLQLYVSYFADKGCRFFNIGADEYANDKYTSGGMGFGQLQSAGHYDEFVAFVNSAAAVVRNAGMIPMAFNDGLYYGGETSYSFDGDIVVCYWSSGWSGYNVAPASTVAGQGHCIINTNDGWYYVLGRTSGTYALPSAQSNTVSISCTSVPSGGVTPNGCMICLWCDDPGASYNDTEAANLRGLLNNLSVNNSAYFGQLPEVDSGSSSVTDEDSGVTVSTDSTTGTLITELSVTAGAPVSGKNGASMSYEIKINGGAYTGAATVTIPYDSAFDGCILFWGEADGDIFPVEKTDAGFLCHVPHFSTITVNGTDGTVELEVGETATYAGLPAGAALDENYDKTVVAVSVSQTSGGAEASYKKDTDGIDSGSRYLLTLSDGTYAVNTYSSNDNAWYVDSLPISPINLDGTADLSDKLWTITQTNGGYYVQNSAGQYMDIATRNNSGNNTVTLSNQARVCDFTKSGDGYMIFADESSIGLNNAGGSYQTALGWPGKNSNTVWFLYKYSEESKAVTKVSFTGLQTGTTEVTVGDVTFTVTVKEKTEEVNLYLGGSPISYPDKATGYTLTAGDISCVEVKTDGTNITFKPLAEGTATVKTANATYKISVTEEDLSAVPSIRAEFWCTSLQLSSGGQNYMVLTAQQLQDGAYTELLAPTSFAVSDSNTKTDGYYYWKAMVIDRAQTGGGQVEDGVESGDNECVTESPAAYEIDALRYADGAYWFRVVDTGEWMELNWGGPHEGNPTQTGHQLVFYYACRYVNYTENSETIAGIYTSDWGASYGTNTIKFELYEVTNNDYENADLKGSNQDGFGGGIRLVVTVFDSSYEIIKTVVDYEHDSIEDREYSGQITDIPAVTKGYNATVKVYIQLKETYSVYYDWLNNPGGTTLPTGASGLAKNDKYTVDTAYPAGMNVIDGAYTYTFSGWYLDNALTQKAPAELTMSGDVTLYGRWSKELTDGIVVTADSASKIYDGKELKAPGFTVSYHGTVIEANENGNYVIEGEEVTITATVTGSITNVGTAANRITASAAPATSTVSDDERTEYSVTTINGILKVTPKITVKYYLESLDNTPLGTKDLETKYEVGAAITLDSDVLNAEKPDNCFDGEQQGTVPYTVTGQNEQTIQVLYRYKFTSLTIYKSGNVQTNEGFLFLVEDITDTNKPSFTVSVGGKGSVTIAGLMVGHEYKITEQTDWSWRYKAEYSVADQTITLEADATKNIVTVTNTKNDKIYLLDGEDYKPNINKPTAAN